MNYTFITWNLHTFVCMGGGLAGVSAGWEMKPKMFPAFPFWVSLRSVCFISCSAYPWPVCARLFLASTLSEKHFSQDVNVPGGFPSFFIGMTTQRLCFSERDFFLSSPFSNALHHPSLTPLNNSRKASDCHYSYYLWVFFLHHQSGRFHLTCKTQDCILGHLGGHVPVSEFTFTCGSIILLFYALVTLSERCCP